MVIVGLPDAAVKKAREWLLASIMHFALDVTNPRKNGDLLDLAIAIGVLKE
ncbi:hypothetical protein FIU87_19540 [Bacillus sp. THAF10]|nr:hypothetical protein FIU87_19540 [Bacillus sp. THAF10]